MPPENSYAVRRRLLRWYESSHRDLPWRRTRDPYAIWIAETMLQQTQVTTVVPYYERFLKSFPTVGALDRAPLSRILALWSGLGYYRRAENLKKCARVLALKHRSRLPDDHRELMALPGVGAYTAGALMSIAYGKCYAAVDGNVRRVLGRMFRIEPQSGIVEKTAERLLPRRRPGDFNQALMELGATICMPRMPRCTCCPVRRYCRTGQKQSYTPVITVKPLKLLRKVVWPVAILRSSGKILLRRRPAGGILAGLWELPGGEAGAGNSLDAVLRAHLSPVGRELPHPVRLREIRHAITDRSITAPVFLFELDSRAASRRRLPLWRWFDADSLSRHPVSSMTIKALKSLAAHEKNPG